MTPYSLQIVDNNVAVSLSLNNHSNSENPINLVSHKIGQVVNQDIPECLSESDYTAENPKYLSLSIDNNSEWVRLFRIGKRSLYFTSSEAPRYAQRQLLPMMHPEGSISNVILHVHSIPAMRNGTQDIVWIVGEIDGDGAGGGS